MKILLVSTNREMLPDPVFPLGLAYIAGALEEAGYDVETVDLCFLDEDDVENTLSAAITSSAPDVIGLSIRNIDDVSYPEPTSYLELYRRVVETCRLHSKATLVMGGAGFTIMPKDFLETLDVDYGVVGEGEQTIVTLMEFLEAGAQGELPRGIMTKGSTLQSPSRLNGWGTSEPARKFFDPQTYYEKGGMLSLQTRRGCPFRCAYCTYPMIEGSKPRLRPVREVIDEVEHIIDTTGARHLFIVDSVFNHPKDYAMEFCDELLRRRIEINWSCYANAGLMDGELIEKMREAGCEGVEFGTDGMVDDVLEALGKGFTYAEVKEASRLCREQDLRFCHFIFLGSPDEDPDKATLAVERLAALEANVSIIMAGIRIFPGTPLARRAEAELGLEHAGLEPVFYIAPKMLGALEGIVDRAIADHPTWIVPGIGRNFNERIQKILRRSGRRGVLWDMLR